MKKILLTGTTSAGKTSLLEAFKKKLTFQKHKIMIIPEIARELLDQQPSLEKDPYFQDILFAEQTQREIRAAQQQPDLLFLDRGVLDILAHARLFGQVIKPEWQDWTRQGYDLVLWLDKNDIDFQVTELQKQISDRDWVKFRDELDVHIQQTVLESGLPWQKLSGTLEERLIRLELLFEVLRTPEGQSRPGKERR